ncbi:phosphotransferase [Dactylosporangium sp. NPDC051485]|uniref:phosphotransferase enzyme family protein n=1 Tax=Dactylosporangium sp. NPDC051485 TaxID=3154846 RepID=UPI0034375315
MTVPTTEASSMIADVLAHRYAFVPERLVQLPIGQGTINYRATCADRDVFVKHYPPDADIAREADAITLSALAGLGGVPVAGLLRNRDDQPIDTSTAYAVSVWEWMPGTVVTAQPTHEQSRNAGSALGRIHTIFASLPASTGPSPQAQAWLAVDPADLTATVDRLTAIIDTRIAAGTADTFDLDAAATLAERRDCIGEIPQLVAELPELTTQVLHGDYSPVNLLFDGAELTAVIDFRPPDPFFTAYEIGRMAFYPNVVATTTDWLSTARALLKGYLQANPTVAADDIRASAQVALLQLLTSLYGVKQHYLKPGLFQDAVDEFWLLRHRTARVLLDHKADTAALLHDLTAHR